MLYLIVGMIIGAVTGLAIGGSYASLSWARAEIRRLRNEAKNREDY